MNIYWYVGNNGIIRVDALGLAWFRQPNEPYMAGREGSIIPPGKGLGKLIDDWVPAGHDFATLHDGVVDNLVSNGVPDSLANIPTMPGVYFAAVLSQFLPSPTPPNPNPNPNPDSGGVDLWSPTPPDWKC